MAGPPTVLLFDVDGTLLTTHGAGRRALERAFWVRFKERNACAGIELGGMTDRAIFRAGLTAIGKAASEDSIDELIEVYLEELADEVRGADPAHYRLNNGISEALEVACATPGVAVGLGTGNVKQGARIKLERVGAYSLFAFGGFGCDSENRAELIRRGGERGAARFGAELSACRVVVVGDTPRDVAAAREAGFTSLALATGSYSVAELEAAGADHAFLDLAEPEALGTLLQRG